MAQRQQTFVVCLRSHPEPGQGAVHLQGLGVFRHPHSGESRGRHGRSRHFGMRRRFRHRIPREPDFLSLRRQPWNLPVWRRRDLCGRRCVYLRPRYLGTSRRHRPTHCSPQSRLRIRRLDGGAEPVHSRVCQHGNDACPHFGLSQVSGGAPHRPGHRAPRSSGAGGSRARDHARYLGVGVGQHSQRRHHLAARGRHGAMVGLFLMERRGRPDPRVSGGRDHFGGLAHGDLCSGRPGSVYHVAAGFEPHGGWEEQLA